MRPIAAWCTFIAVYGEAQEHGQLVLGVESHYKEHDATLCIFICLRGRALSEWYCCLLRVDVVGDDTTRIGGGHVLLWNFIFGHS
jgi:hypothetical protein